MGSLVSAHLATLVAIFLVIVLLALSYLGYLPRYMSSIAARFLRFPRDSMIAVGLATRGFNYNVVDDVIIVGRLPRSLEDYLELVQVGRSHVACVPSRPVQTLYALQKHQVRAVIDCTEDWEHIVPVEDVRSKTGLDIR